MNDSRPRLAYELLSAAQVVEERLEHALEARGLSLAKFKVLRQLATAGEPVPLGSLADRMSCVRSNITQLVDRLEAEKLVVRSADPVDRRSVRAELTPEGRARHEEALRVVQAAEDEAFTVLGPVQREALVSLMRAIRHES